MISQNYPVIAKHVTLAAPNHQVSTVVPASIELDNGKTVQVAHNQDTGTVSYWNPRSKKFEFFRSLEEASTELSLEAMGLRRISTEYSYKGNSVIVYGSIFAQAEKEVQDEYRDQDYFLKTNNSFIWYFAFCDKHGIKWYSHENKQECLALLRTAVDFEECPESFEF
jgi:hypothetical protein